MNQTSAPDRRAWVPEGHSLLLSRSEPDLLDALVTWTRVGLERGEKVVHAGLGEAEEQAVRDAVPGSAERVTVLRTVHPDVSRLVRAARAEGYDAVRLSVDVHTALGLTSSGAHESFERDLVALCRDLPLHVLCAYDARRTVGEDLTAAVRHHPAVVETSVVVRTTRDTADGIPVTSLAGYVDLANADLVQVALARAAASAPDQRLVLDTSGLRLLSVAGARALADGTRQLRDAGGQVELRCPPSAVGRILQLVGVDRGWVLGPGAEDR